MLKSLLSGLFGAMALAAAPQAHSAVVSFEPGSGAVYFDPQLGWQGWLDQSGMFVLRAAGEQPLSPLVENGVFSSETASMR